MPTGVLKLPNAISLLLPHSAGPTQPLHAAPPSATCGFCHLQLSPYVCPRCNAPYCSLRCFSSDAHGGCSEAFVKRELEAEVAGREGVSREERVEMMRMLKRLEDEELEDEDEDEGEGGEDQEMLAKLSELDLDTADPSLILSLLPPASRDAFLAAVRDPSSDAAQELLSGVAASAPPKPWWEFDPEAGEVARPAPAEVERAPGGEKLGWNLVAILLAYAYTTRRLSLSPLASATTSRADSTEARHLLSALLPFLADRKSTLALSSTSEAIDYVFSRLDEPNPSPSLPPLLLADVHTLLAPSPLITSPSPSSANSSRAHLALSDILALFSPAGAPDNPTPTTAKLRFYLSRLAGIASLRLREGVRRRREREAEGVGSEERPREGLMLGTEEPVRMAGPGPKIMEITEEENQERMEDVRAAPPPPPVMTRPKIEEIG